MTVKRIAAITLCLATFGTLAWFRAYGDKPASAQGAAAPSLELPADVGNVSPAAPVAVVPATEHMANPLERAADLRATYERYKNSKNASERHAAYRAWSACFPTFIAAEGQAASLESVTQGVSANAPNSAQRIEAYRTLMGRCKNFSDMPREQLLAETARQKGAWSKGAAQAPGDIAAKLLLAGDAERARDTARAVIASRDPAAIFSLRQFMNQYVEQQIDGEHSIQQLRPDLRSLAFAMAACELGLECGPDSLTALQQCANTGMCSGSVGARYLASMDSAADRERLERETQLVLAAIRAGDFKALGL